MLFGKILSGNLASSGMVRLLLGPVVLFLVHCNALSPLIADYRSAAPNDSWSFSS
jgi:hypothetical protein